jgi:hypothetical protein
VKCRSYISTVMNGWEAVIATSLPSIYSIFLISCVQKHNNMQHIHNNKTYITDGRDEMEFNAARDQTLAAQALFLLQEHGYSAEAADLGSEA